MSEAVRKLSLAGVLPNGTPVWVLFGSEGENDDPKGDDPKDDEDDSDDDDDNDDDPKDDEEQKKLNDAGKRALDRERDRRKKAVKDLAPWATLGREHGTPEEIRAKLAGKSTEDVEKVRSEGNARVDTMRQNIAKLAVRALASDFVDPDDAARYINFSSIEVGEDGEIDEDEIRDELAAVLEKKPHLKKSAETPKKRVPKPDPSQGGGKNPKGTNSSATLEAGAERYNRLMGKKPKA